MNQDRAIHIEGLGKRYRRGETVDLKRTFRETLATLPRHFANKLRRAAATPAAHARGSIAADAPDPDTPPGTFWALRDVTLDIHHGDVVGLIGPNGAGKSTLLKLLSRVTNPTAGRAELHGRIASLLEVGTGFHQELTGRENVYFNAAVLGMRKAEIDRRFDEIVEFAGVERFIDTPVKRYSSGMYVRLAFAVAAHLEAKVMLVDEVLAVGDSEFQKKCLGRLKDMSSTGRTVIYVSHNMTSVRELCRRAIHLDQGRLVQYGPVQQVIEQYLKGSEDRANEVAWTDLKTAPGDDKARVTAVRVLGRDGAACRVADIDQPVVIETDYAVLTDGSPLNLALYVYNREDVCVFCAPSMTDAQWYQRPHPIGRYRSRCTIPGRLLNKGYYFASVFLVEKGNYPVTHLHRIVAFELIDLESKGSYYGSWIGIIRPQLEWKTERLD
jgi:lipopolysaccharide transport system ATP-binding protein